MEKLYAACHTSCQARWWRLDDELQAPCQSMSKLLCLLKDSGVKCELICLTAESWTELGHDATKQWSQAQRQTHIRTADRNNQRVAMIQSKSSPQPDCNAAHKQTSANLNEPKQRWRKHGPKFLHNHESERKSYRKHGLQADESWDELGTAFPFWLHFCLIHHSLNNFRTWKRPDHFYCVDAISHFVCAQLLSADFICLFSCFVILILLTIFLSF